LSDIKNDIPVFESSNTTTSFEILKQNKNRLLSSKQILNQMLSLTRYLYQLA